MQYFFYVLHDHAVSIGDGRVTILHASVAEIEQKGLAGIYSKCPHQAGNGLSLHKTLLRRQDHWFKRSESAGWQRVFNVPAPEWLKPHLVPEEMDSQGFLKSVNVRISSNPHINAAMALVALFGKLHDMPVDVMEISSGNLKHHHGQR